MFSSGDRRSRRLRVRLVRATSPHRLRVGARVLQMRRQAHTSSWPEESAAARLTPRLLVGKSYIATWQAWCTGTSPVQPEHSLRLACSEPIRDVLSLTE